MVTTDAIRQRLATCLVDDVALQAALRDDYDAFVLARSETVHARLINLLGLLADSGREDAATGDGAEPDVDLDPDEPTDRNSAD